MGAPLRVQVTFRGDICPGIIIQVDIHLGTHSRVRSFHHLLLTRFHPNSGTHDQHLVRWSVPFELFLGVYHGMTILMLG